MSTILEEEHKLSLRNFKNLRISVNSSTSDDNTCKCATYFNMDSSVEHSMLCDNSPTTVKNTSSDSCIYGTHYPNRIFVGHLPGKATATDLADFFRSYGTVLEGKVVLDSFGRSRRFGFVTFATQDDVQNVLKEESVFFKGKKINVGPAVKKMFGAELSGTDSPVADPKEDSSSSTNENETIITVPPVNEGKEENGPTSPKIGNVWLKVNAKPKHVTKKQMDNISPSPVVYTPQAVSMSPSYVYPAYYTVPFTQGYNYTGFYYTPQSPMYHTQCTQQVMPYQQWSPVNGYSNGPLTVA